MEHSYGFDNGQQSEQKTKSGNKIIHGDNLEALKSHLPKYEGKNNCIYIDPHFNTDNETWVNKEDDVNAAIIKGARTIFTPGPNFKEMLTGMKCIKAEK